MAELALEYAAGAGDVGVLALPDEPLPSADAVVSVGHVVSCLDAEAAVARALEAIAGAVRPGGLFAVDIDANVLIDTAGVPDLLAGSGLDVTVTTSFGTEALPVGLRVVIGRRPPTAAVSST